jgi:hypothetical protein
MMTTDKYHRLHALRAELAELEQQVAAARAKEFASLPQQYGFETTAEFIAAVQKATGGRRRRRTRITDETRAQVKKMVEAGKTGSAIAAALKISLPSVQNIKKALGLVQKRRK